MEQTIKPKETGMLKPSISNASIISVALIILTLVFYLLNNHGSNVESIIGTVIFLTGLIYSIKVYRDEYLEGYISYGQSLGHSVLIGVFTGIITGVFIFILYTFIAPDLFEQVREKALLEAERRMLQMNPNVTDAELDMVVNLQTKFIRPIFSLIGNVFIYTLTGLVLGLIVSIFMKKKNPDPFSATEV
jgi:hypothetical protein